ncbi:GH32 C-terminal domain-containing protein [Sphingopyxis sp. R3-92]|uniref:GH32 C-terminal domain-containing protein n=1 Tax=Sphingopyxis sp. R3-92 TaxID=3158553 RepID=UPI003EE71291
MALLAPANAAAQAVPDQPLLRLEFEGAAATAASGVRIATQFPEPDFVPGVTGQAWRSDGFSSSATVPLALSPAGGFTVKAWVALESYPSAIEAPTDQQTAASIIQQASRDAGFDVFIDTYGRWGLRVSTARGIREVRAAKPFPLYAWAQVGASYDPASGTATLYLNGTAVGQDAKGGPAAFKPARANLEIAKSWRDAPMLVFNVNGLNGAFDNVEIYDRAIPASQIADAAGPPPIATAALAVPPSRFAADRQRPRYHAMPPANWTNEPHGLIRRGDMWHLFYQRTPNGPYKTQMVWGHMVSKDLIHWVNLQDALRPQLQNDHFGFDMKGIWSGDVVTGDDGKAYAFYTSVNHSPDIYNPGISVAVSDDEYLRGWSKLGPVLDRTGLRDFRDPYLWKDNGAWHMIVGAAMLGQGGGLAYYRCDGALSDTKCWKKQPDFAPFGKMDIGSDIWEMPVFEKLAGDKYLLVANPIGGSVSKYGKKATRGVYWIGRWDGSRFQPDDVSPKMLDLIPGHLSPTVSRMASGELVGIGIVDERRTTEAQLKAGWAHTFALPRVYRLMPDGKTLGQAPLPALQGLRQSAHAEGKALSVTGDRKIADFGSAYELIADFSDVPPTGKYGVYIHASADGPEVTRIYYDREARQIVLDKRKSSTGGESEGPLLLTGDYDVAAFGEPRSFHVFVDHSVVDVFVNDAAAFSFRVYPANPESGALGLMSEGPAKANIQAWALDLQPAGTAGE